MVAVLERETDVNGVVDAAAAAHGFVWRVGRSVSCSGAAVVFMISAIA